jgi:hypothetical protein
MPALKVDQHGFAEFRAYLDIFQRRRIAASLKLAGFRVLEGNRLMASEAMGERTHFVRLHLGEDRRKASRIADKALREMP